MRRTVGGAVGPAMTGRLEAQVPVWGLAGMASVVSWSSTSSGASSAAGWSLHLWAFAHGCVAVMTATSIACLSLGVGVTTGIALGIGREGINVNDRCCGGHCSDDSEISSSILLGHLVLLALGLKQFAVGEKGLVCELGLLFEPDPVPGLMVLHGMLQDHDLQHFLSLEVGKLTLGDKGIDASGQGKDILIRELAGIREELIPKVPEMLLRLDSSADSIKGKLGVL